MRALDMGLLDVLMFSINPAYDYKRGEYGIGSVDERMELYRRCERDGVGISVMKPFAGGQLLNARTSPFKKALGEYQCLQYALDKPGVMTVLPGVRNREDLAACSASLMPVRASETTPSSLPSPPPRLRASAFTATTASPARGTGRGPNKQVL